MMQRADRSNDTAGILFARSALAGFLATALLVACDGRNDQPIVVATATLEPCSGANTAETVKQAIEQNAASNIINIKVLDFGNAQETWFDQKNNARYCQADAVLNTGEATISYKIFFGPSGASLVEVKEGRDAFGALAARHSQDTTSIVGTANVSAPQAPEDTGPRDSSASNRRARDGVPIPDNSPADAAALPSFDCSKARAEDELAICGDVRLAEAEHAASVAYHQVLTKHEQEARSEARAILRDRHSCSGDQLCILVQLVRSIDVYSDLGSTVPIPRWMGGYMIELYAKQGEPGVDHLPRSIGQCARARVALITSRFGEQLKPPSANREDSGTAISYSNGGFQVSYEYVAAIAESQVGDNVLVCLVSVPKNCPPGDNRGKVYSGANMRTKGFWVLPDSSHMCGGA